LNIKITLLIYKKDEFELTFTIFNKVIIKKFKKYQDFFFKIQKNHLFKSKTDAPLIIF
jgi:hypothetical protein